MLENILESQAAFARSCGHQAKEYLQWKRSNNNSSNNSHNYTQPRKG